MRASTHNARRELIACAVIAVVVGTGIAMASWFGPIEHSGDRVFAGRYGPGSDLQVANLSIPGGRVTVGYSVEVLFLPDGRPSSMHCGLVDTSARLDFFAGSHTVAPSGEWTKLEFADDYDLPEITLGIRCSPERSGGLTVVFRDAEVHALPLD